MCVRGGGGVIAHSEPGLSGDYFCQIFGTFFPTFGRKAWQGSPDRRQVATEVNFITQNCAIYNNDNASHLYQVGTGLESWPKKVIQ